MTATQCTADSQDSWLKFSLLLGYDTSYVFDGGNWQDGDTEESTEKEN